MSQTSNTNNCWTNIREKPGTHPLPHQQGRVGSLHFHPPSPGFTESPHHHSSWVSEKLEWRFWTFTSARQERAPPCRWRPLEKAKSSRGSKEAPLTSPHWGGVRKSIVENRGLEATRPPSSPVVSGEARRAAARRHHYPSRSGRDQLRLRGEMKILLSAN